MVKRLVVPLKVLFIGNSFTQRNDLPGLIAKLASARGREMQHQLITAGGASLRRHWNAGHARSAISEGHYDFVVLQEQSTLPIKNSARMHENVRLFDEAIHEAGSKTVLYMTWARQHSPESQQDITKAYISVGRERGAMVVPVGTVWQSYIYKHDHPVLHDRDQSHPSLAGSYLAACVFVAAMLKENPVGIVAEIFGLDDEVQLQLRKAAWRECQPKSRWK